MPSPLNLFFKEVIYINLGRRPDRLQTLLPTFEKSEIIATRFPAIDCVFLGVHPTEACQSSHKEIIKYAKSKNLDSIFIFEDDVELANDFNEVVSQALKELPNDWCMFYAGGNYDGVHPVPYSNHLNKITHLYATHAYAVHSRMYDVILGSPNCIIDVYYTTLHITYPTYITKPRIAFQRADYSDIMWMNVNYTELKE